MALEDWYQSRTLVFGHRGASGYAPMNTLPAFELAADMGADGIELDVWLSRDDELVILHDATVDHTTDGTGYIYDKTLAELKALSASYKFADAYPDAKIPTLDEVFDTVGHRLLINVEIKADVNMRSGTEQAVADCIARHGLEARVIISSFSAQVLQTFRAVKPDVPIGFLFDAETPSMEWELLSGLPHEALHPHYPLIEPLFMERAKAGGYRVNVWTVNDLARAIALAHLGVDAVIGDYPDRLLSVLGRQG